MKPSSVPSEPSFADITIDSLGGLGDGLSQLGGKPLFVEKAAPGDRLRVRIIHETKENMRGEIVEVLQGGPDRVSAPCVHFSACGGCGLQQLKIEFYQESKRKVLRSALAHGGFPDVKADVTFLPAASRRRVEFKWADGRFAFYASRTRDMVAIDNCLILEPALQALMAPLAKQLAKWHAARAIKTVSLTAADSGIDMELECSSVVEDTTTLSALADTLNIARISLIVPGQKPITVVSRVPVTMRLGIYDVALPPGAFLQASKEGQRLLTEAVIAGIGEAKSVADLFCGIGTYSFALHKMSKVHCVESDIDMVKGLKSMIHIHGRNRFMTTEQRDLFTTPLSAKELEKYDAVIINPPRPGAKAQTVEIAKSNIKTVIMVSCNPASFARDAKALKEAGFSVTNAQGIDQFVYSPHLEIVAVFKR